MEISRNVAICDISDWMDSSEDIGDIPGLGYPLTQQWADIGDILGPGYLASSTWRYLDGGLVLGDI